MESNYKLKTSEYVYLPPQVAAPHLREAPTGTLNAPLISEIHLPVTNGRESELLVVLREALWAYIEYKRIPPNPRLGGVKGIIVIAPSLGFGGILLYCIYIAQRASINTYIQSSVLLLSLIRDMVSQL